MKLFNIGRAFQRAQREERQTEQLTREAESYKLAGVLPAQIAKYAMLVLLGIFNASLFLRAVPGWRGYATAALALTVEFLAAYCIHSFIRTTGAHKWALGISGFVLLAFSITHAGFSYQQATVGLSAAVEFYAHHVALPLMVGLVTVASVGIYLSHWSARISQEQAATQVTIAQSRARLVGESAQLRDENEIERARLAHLREKIRLGNEYVAELESFASMRERERQALARIKDPDIRAELANAMGIKADESKPQGPVMLRQDFNADGKGNGKGKQHGIL